jgi:hypothetical protein
MPLPQCEEIFDFSDFFADGVDDLSDESARVRAETVILT